MEKSDFHYYDWETLSKDVHGIRNRKPANRPRVFVSLLREEGSQHVNFLGLSTSPWLSVD